MVRTRRAQQQHMQITRWLPNEVLIRIIRDAKRVDQVTLCRVSKLFHALSWPILYRTVVLHLDDTGLSAFCYSLIENPERADAIRSFTLKEAKQVAPLLRFDHYAPNFSPDYDNLGAAMNLMGSLEHLLLLFDDGLPAPSPQVPRTLNVSWAHPFWNARRGLSSSMRAMASIVADLSYPCLRRCVLQMAKGHWRKRFLLAHGSTLTEVSLGWWKESHSVESAPSGHCLPRLQVFHGSAELLPRLVGGTSLEGARLLYNNNPEQIFNDAALSLKVVFLPHSTVCGVQPV
ncbi:hypothetical protein FB45DRAFT_875114 [Roridomyces roridus]|uniref:F-box domain-containing protein n=1 Tax=Roridomyces roridus TaxID=1738132 RepID=A0AAD7FAH4_9AGAR|nr:hypothetical protein FB45DRAFT_875114 [Roridomyces roridus]